ncbi:unnamed protein product, partial [Brenthis ino]
MLITQFKYLENKIFFSIYFVFFALKRIWCIEWASLLTSEGDIFCFMTDFTNPNCLKFNKEDPKIEFKALNFMITLAKSFTWSDDKNLSELDEKDGYIEKKKSKYRNTPVITERKPVFFADGLLAMDILKSLSDNIPNDLIFCPSPITAIAKTVQCDVINDVLVWAANDEVFHVEVEKPLIINDFHCKSDMIRKDFLESLNLDSTQFSAAWMKKEFIEKVASSASKNPYGCIYRAAEFSKTLRDIWLTRIQDDVTKVYTNMGVISDGSLGTIKGYPYILPIVMSKGSWSIDRRFEDDTYLKMEIKRLNKMAKDQHVELISHCKNFLRENVIYQAFRDEDDSGSTSKY